MKSVLISIQPKWVEKIASGKKTIEVRKTRPKLETPFKCYIYCTNSNGTLFMAYDGLHYGKDYVGRFDPACVNGKVIGEFVCNEISNYIEKRGNDFYWTFQSSEETKEFFDKTCLRTEQLFEYVGDSNYLYGWHISDLIIYDKPKELSEFIKPFKYDGDGLRCCTKEELEDIYEWDCETLFKNKYPNFDFDNCKCEDCPKAKDFYRLTRPPQSWCYVKV